MAAKKKSAIEARVGHPEAIIDDIIVIGKKLVKNIKNSRLDKKYNRLSEKVDKKVLKANTPPYPKNPVKMPRIPKAIEEYDKKLIHKEKIAQHYAAAVKRKALEDAKLAKIKANAPKGQKILDEYTKKRRAGGSEY